MNNRWQSILVYTLVMVFGSSTWLSVTAIWVELPLMVSVYPLPEGWSLPSFLTFVVQLAALGPILHWLFGKIAPVTFNSPASTRLQIYACLTIATFSTLLLSVYWDTTAFIWGVERSVGLMVLLFCVSMVSCTSSLLYLPSMFRFQPPYITAYFVGMGFSAMIPSLLALIQGSGRTVCHVANSTYSTNDSIDFSGNISAAHSVISRAVEPHFHVSTFYFLMFVWMLLCTIAYGLLNMQSIVGCALNDYADKNRTENLTLEDPGYKESNALSTDEQDAHSRSQQNERTAVFSSVNFQKVSPLLLLLITCWCCALMNGILPSIQSYACLPYGTTVFYLTAILSNLANPVGCFTLFFCSVKQSKPIILLTACVIVLSAYIMTLALSSPRPIFGHSFLGSFLCVSSYVVAGALLAYLRALCGSLLRETNNQTMLWWCGVSTQAGSFLASVLMFPLVNVFHVFKSASTCS